MQLEIPLESMLLAAQTAKLLGARVILDPAPCPGSLAIELLKSVDILTPNETEAVQLLDFKPAGLSMDEAREVALRLQRLGPSSVIIKLGARGCLLAEQQQISFIEAPAVAALDTSAAGDVFNAAFVVAKVEGASSAIACHFAAHAAALSVTRLGAQRSMPSRAEVTAFQND